MIGLWIQMTNRKTFKHQCPDSSTSISQSYIRCNYPLFCILLFNSFDINPPLYFLIDVPEAYYWNHILFNKSQ